MVQIFSNGVVALVKDGLAHGELFLEHVSCVTHLEVIVARCVAARSVADHGRPQEFFQRGAKPSGLIKMTYFSARRRRQRKFSLFFRRFRLNLRVFYASAEGASENFAVFSTGTAYDVIIFKFQGGGNCPRLPPSGRLCCRRCVFARRVVVNCPVRLGLLYLCCYR